MNKTLIGIFCFALLVSPIWAESSTTASNQDANAIDGKMTQVREELRTALAARVGDAQAVEPLLEQLESFVEDCASATEGHGLVKDGFPKYFAQKLGSDLSADGVTEQRQIRQLVERWINARRLLNSAR